MSKLITLDNLAAFKEKLLETTSLANYYSKDDTYTKSEIAGIISAVNQLSFQVADSLPENPGANEMNTIYLIPSTNGQSDNTKEEYVLINNGDTYTWEKIGSTDIDLSDYVTTEDLETKQDTLTPGSEMVITNNVINTKNKIAADTENSLITITTADGKTYAVPGLVELKKPQEPTINTTTAIVVAGGTAPFTLSAAEDATIKYTISSSPLTNPTIDSLTNEGKNVVVNPTFTHTSPVANKVFYIYAAAIAYGQTSNIVELAVTINQKVSPGNVTVTRTPNNNNWATKAAITLTPSPTVGATSEYTTNGSNWTTFSSTTTLEVTSSVAANMYKVRATMANLVASDIKQNSAITLNAKKFYVGFGPATLANEAAITSLTNVQSYEKATMAGTYDIESTVAGQYIWFCGTGTLTKVTSGGFDVPMNTKVTVDGYNCYRGADAVNALGNNSFVIV